MVKTSKGDAYFKTGVIADPYLEDTTQATENENVRAYLLKYINTAFSIRNQFLTYSFNNIIVETPITISLNL